MGVLLWGRKMLVFVLLLSSEWEMSSDELGLSLVTGLGWPSYY